MAFLSLGSGLCIDLLRTVCLLWALANSPVTAAGGRELRLDDPALALVLEESLALLSAGETPELIAERFPDFSDALLPLLSVAGELREGAEDAIDDPVDFLHDLGEYLKNQIGGDDSSEAAGSAPC